MSFELEKIANNIERIADNVNGSGSGTASGGGFTNVYFDIEDNSGLLRCRKNGEYVPFTLMDLIEDMEAGGVKTIPVLTVIQNNPVTLPMSEIVGREGYIILSFIIDNDIYEFNANEENDYQFIMGIPLDGDNPPK